MNLIILVAVFLSFTTIGIIIWYRYHTRKVYFDNLLSFCNHLLVEINFSKNTVMTVIQRYQSAYSQAFKETITSYAGLLESKSDITRQSTQSIMWKQLKVQEADTIADFLTELGRHGSTQETEKIENKKIHFLTFQKNAEDQLRTKASIYLKICIILGVAAVILLI